MFSHRLHRFTQNCLLSVFSHRFHRTYRTACWVCSPTDFTDLHRLFGCLQGGALVSSAPTKQYRYTSCYVGALETSAPPEVSRFCEFCVFCGRTSPAEGSVNSACSVGGTLLLRRQGYLRYYLRTLTICVDLWNLWEALLCRRFCEFCVFCGRHFAAAEARIPPLLSSHPNHLCRSVKSVGDSSLQKVLWIPRVLWEAFCDCGGKDTSATIFAP